MGKKPTFKPNLDTAAPPRPVEALLSSFDPHAAYFAIVSQGVDRHRLRIFDTETATVKNDFSSEKEDKFTCMAWGIMQSGGELSEQPSTPSKKKKRRSTISTLTTQVLALGLHDGSVAIYSLSQGSVLKTLSGSHTMPVSDFVFTADGRRGYSVAEDHYIVEWDVEEAAEISKWKADTKSISKIALSHSETKLLAAGHTIKLWDLETRTIVKKFTGHASIITSLVFSSTDAVCASTAEHDRYINIWDCSPSLDITESGNLTALTLDTDASYLALDGANTVLAVSEDGTLALWQNAGSPTATTGQAALGASSSHPPAKKRRGATRPPDAMINVVSSVDGKTAIPILRAEFVEGMGSGIVLIARGSTVRPTFEKVRYIKEDTGEFMKEIILSRQPVTSFLIDESSLAAANLKATRKGYDESSVTVLGNTDFGLPDATLGPDSYDDDDSSARHTDEPTLEEKLKDLAVDEPSAKQTTPAVPQKRSTPKADSLQQTLVQALHSGDTALLEACLLHSNPEVIRNTVRRLPTAYVVPFLTQLVAKFQGRSNRGEALLEWLKAVLLIHTAYLMTVPDLVKKLSSFYRSLDSRLSVFQKLLQLHGRLDLVMSQIATRAQYTAEDTTNDVVNVYVEEDDEDEDEEDEEDDGVMGLEEDEDEDMLDLVGDADVFGEEEEGDDDGNAMANDTDEEGESEMSEDEDEDDEDDD